MRSRDEGHKGLREHGVTDRSHETLIYHPVWSHLSKCTTHGAGKNRKALRYVDTLTQFRTQSFLLICPQIREISISASENSWRKIKQNKMILPYLSMCVFASPGSRNWNIVSSEIYIELCSKTQFALSVHLLPSSLLSSLHAWLNSLSVVTWDGFMFVSENFAQRHHRCPAKTHKNNLHSKDKSKLKTR